jgi:hypothetical protein
LTGSEWQKAAEAKASAGKAEKMPAMQGRD